MDCNYCGATLTRKCVVAVSFCPAAGIAGACKSAIVLGCDKIHYFLQIKEENLSVGYLAGDVRGHGRRRLRVGVGVLGDEA